MKYEIKRRPPGTKLRIGDEIELNEENKEWYLKGGFVKPKGEPKERAVKSNIETAVK